MNARRMFGMLIVGAFGMGFAFASMSNTADEQKNEPKELAQARADYESKVAPIRKAYVQRLEQLKKSFGSKGDTDAMNAIQKEIDSLNPEEDSGKMTNPDKKTNSSAKEGIDMADFTWNGETPFELPDGSIKLAAKQGDKERLMSGKSYSPPFKIRAMVETDSYEIRFYYNKGRIIFGWEGNPTQLRVHDLLTGACTPVDGVTLKPNKMHDITIEVERSSLCIKMNNKTLFKGKGDYKDISAPVGISPAWNSIIKVKSFIVEKGK